MSCFRLKVANMLVVGSMVGPFKLSTMFGVLSVGMTMFKFLMLSWVWRVLIITIEVSMTLYVCLRYGNIGIQFYFYGMSKI